MSKCQMGNDHDAHWLVFHGQSGSDLLTGVPHVLCMEHALQEQAAWLSSFDRQSYLFAPLPEARAVWQKMVGLDV